MFLNPKARTDNAYMLLLIELPFWILRKKSTKGYVKGKFSSKQICLLFCYSRFGLCLGGLTAIIFDLNSAILQPGTKAKPQMSDKRRPRSIGENCNAEI